MATLVVLKTSLSAPTASFFAALSTASSLRLAAFATAGPPGCTLRPAQKPDLWTQSPQDTPGKTTLKACPPEPDGAGCRGSNQTGFTSPTATWSENPVFTRLCR